MKLPKLKLTLLLIASLLLSSCTETESSIRGLLAAILVYSGIGGIVFEQGGLLPPNQSDTDQINVIVAESASQTPFSYFKILGGTPDSAIALSGLTGIKASGITAFYGGFVEAVPILYLWHDGTVEILGPDGTPNGSITVVSGAQIRNFVVANDGSLGYATVTGSSKFYILDLVKKSVSQTIDFGTGAVPVASAVSPDGSSVYVVDSGQRYYSVNPSNGTFTTTFTPTAGALAPGIPVVTPDGNQLWIPRQGGVAVIYDLKSGTLSGALSLGSSANFTEIVFSLDGTSAYILSSPSTGNGSIYSVDTQLPYTKNWQATVGADPKGLSLSPAGGFLLVANSGNGYISQISTADGTQISATDVGTAPVGAVMNLDAQ